MIVERNIYVKVTLSAAECYQKDISPKLKPYINKCYEGCYILDILEIHEDSHRSILSWSTVGEAEINVRMTVKALEIKHNSLLRCVVKYVDADNIIIANAADQRIVVNISASGNEQASVGQELVVRANEVMYQQYMEKIVVTGNVYKPVTSFVLTGTITDVTKAYIANVYPKLSNFKYSQDKEYVLEIGGIVEKTLPKKITIDVNSFLMMAAENYAQLE